MEEEICPYCGYPIDEHYIMESGYGDDVELECPSDHWKYTFD